MTETPIYDQLCIETRFFPSLRDRVRLLDVVSCRAHTWLPGDPQDRTWDDEYWWHRKRSRKSGV